MARLVLLLWCLVTFAACQQVYAVEYTVINTASSTAGGARFDSEISIEYTKQVMNSSTGFIWQIFQELTSEDRRDVQNISVFIEPMDGIAYAIIDANEIHVRLEYIGSYSGDVKNEITGVLYHEMTHIWQWLANREVPTGLTEGIADFVRLKAGYAPSHWAKPGAGSRWDRGYDVTAHFLDYCDGLLSGFVADMNKKMKSGYSPEFFVELLGKTVDQLWSDYKTKYGN